MLPNQGFKFLAGVIISTWFVVSAYGGLPPAAQIIPTQFRLVAERNLGGTMVIQATKPNENFPANFVDQGIELNCTWQQNPAAAQVLEIMFQAPEDPMNDAQGIKEEPCGKNRHQGGLLICRKISLPWIGTGDGPDLVTYNISWVGAVPSGLVGVTVDHFYGDPSVAVGWIDAIIPALLANK